MVTDYSSVFFDFAYMKKPIVFYQFDENILPLFNIETEEQLQKISNRLLKAFTEQA